MSFTFFLGTHRPYWLGKLDFPLFVSRRTLSLLKKLPRATAEWALDSGGFSELSMYGRWTITATAFIAEVRRFLEIGRLQWVSVQDWMCEPLILRQTGKTVAEHQRLTIESFQELSALAPEISWTPVLQGWKWGEYFEHIEMYDRAGIDLRSMPVVGLGSVCRRQGTAGAESAINEISSMGINLHGFGFKKEGLGRIHHRLRSADSMAWSFDARRNGRGIADCEHKTCANCIKWAAKWRENLLISINRPAQLGFSFV